MAFETLSARKRHNNEVNSVTSIPSRKRSKSAHRTASKVSTLGGHGIESQAKVSSPKRGKPVRPTASRLRTLGPTRNDKVDTPTEPLSPKPSKVAVRYTPVPPSPPPTSDDLVFLLTRQPLLTIKIDELGEVLDIFRSHNDALEHIKVASKVQSGYGRVKIVRTVQSNTYKWLRTEVAVGKDSLLSIRAHRVRPAGSVARHDISVMVDANNLRSSEGKDKVTGDGDSDRTVRLHQSSSRSVSPNKRKRSSAVPGDGASDSSDSLDSPASPITSNTTNSSGSEASYRTARSTFSNDSSDFATYHSAEGSSDGSAEDWRVSDAQVQNSAWGGAFYSNKAFLLE